MGTRVWKSCKTCVTKDDELKYFFRIVCYITITYHPKRWVTGLYSAHTVGRFFDYAQNDRKTS